jgi:glycosyltransferase involved in cell wall biosynthesis
MKTAAVIVATWRNERWIMECVESIRAQKVSGWDVEVRIGVDGCQATSAVLSYNDVGHWYSPENVGPHVIRNSLITQAPADVYVIFDGDDVMTEGFLAALLPQVGDGLAWPDRQHCDADMTPMEAGPFSCVNGVAAYSREAMTRLGGFRPWRIAADHDAARRARVMGIPTKRATGAVLLRRRHPNALTEARDTSLTSQRRLERKRESRELVRRGELYVDPETVEMQWVEAGVLA